MGEREKERERKRERERERERGEESGSDDGESDENEDDDGPLLPALPRGMFAVERPLKRSARRPRHRKVK